MMKKISIVFSVISGLFSAWFFYMFYQYKSIGQVDNIKITADHANKMLMLGIVALIFAFIWPVVSKMIFKKPDSNEN